MENAWEPMKNRNSWLFKERLAKEFGTMDHMKGKKRKGPQLSDGRILGVRTKFFDYYSFPTFFFFFFTSINNAMEPFVSGGAKKM